MRPSNREIQFSHAAAERRVVTEEDQANERVRTLVAGNTGFWRHGNFHSGVLGANLCLALLLLSSAAEAFTLFPTQTILSKPASWTGTRTNLWPLQLRAEASRLPQCNPFRSASGRDSTGARTQGRFSPLHWGVKRRSTSCVDAAQGKDASYALDGLEVFDVNLDGSGQAKVVWDEKRQRFMKVKVDGDYKSGNSRTQIVSNEFTQLQFSGSSLTKKIKSSISKLKQSFLPRGVTEDYYQYTLWRVAQRIVSSTVSVFGTQSLLLALGVKTNKLGAAAASGWVVANAFGKFSKMTFAARWGRDFDSDAKRWRLRAAVMWVFANGIEIMTFVLQGIWPSSFVVLVAFAVSLKQISILTSAATRGTFYKQFAGKNENLGDITAKGDAQVAVADLVGMVIGIQLARLAGTTAAYVWSAFIVLSILDFFFIIKSLDMIVFRFLNLERATMLANSFVHGDAATVLSPEEVSKAEPLISRPAHCVPSGKLWEVMKGYWSGTFLSISRTDLSPQELKPLVEVFGDSEFMLLHSGNTRAPPPIVLKQSAKDLDIIEALLAREHLVRLCAASDSPVTSTLEAVPLMVQARDAAKKGVSTFLRGLRDQGWSFKDDDEPVAVFGYIRDRSLW